MPVPRARHADFVRTGLVDDRAHLFLRGKSGSRHGRRSKKTEDAGLRLCFM